MAQSAAHKHDSTRTPRATYQDVLDAPAHRVAEIVDGTLYTHPRPAPPHAVASSRLGFDLGGPFDRGRGGPGGWWIIDEAGAAPQRRHPGPRLGGVAPGADGGATRRRVLHPRA